MRAKLLQSRQLKPERRPMSGPGRRERACRSGAGRWGCAVLPDSNDDGNSVPPGKPFPRPHVRPGNFGDRPWPRPNGNVYGALDLGTNNCRLLLARPTRRGFRVIDAFSRIIRLGEGISTSGRLSEAAMGRTVDALRVCASKLERNNVMRRRLVATEACRVAENGAAFLDRVKRELRLDIEILTPEIEASLAVSGCSSLIDPGADYVMAFDIGGGSSEVVWLDFTGSQNRVRDRHVGQEEARASMVAWASLPVGVVTLAERYGGRHVPPEKFEDMIAHVAGMLAAFEERHRFRQRIAGATMHMLGTSGTVTTIAGIQLGLPRYDRSKVDGCWLDVTAVRTVTANLLAHDYDGRVAEPCIGSERADLVLAGCAILEAFLRAWPCERLRVADRGLREGILAQLMSEDGVYRARRRPDGRSHER
jgi:exopolyphosphatase/guanosine-5'-triphosphate,3'-diphosphate pyrophosphatase